MPADFTDVPEADAQEQKTGVSVDDVNDLGVRAIGPDAPEADVLEQARAAPLDDEYEHGA